MRSEHGDAANSKAAASSGVAFSIKGFSSAGCTAAVFTAGGEAETEAFGEATLILLVWSGLGALCTRWAIQKLQQVHKLLIGPTFASGLGARVEAETATR